MKHYLRRHMHRAVSTALLAALIFSLGTAGTSYGACRYDLNQYADSTPKLISRTIRPVIMNAFLVSESASLATSIALPAAAVRAAGCIGYKAVKLFGHK